MIGEINSEVQQRVDSFRDNPQALMQQYQQSQQLIDLLALQKLKSEKEAVARNMQMQMQTMPQTIKQQREAELLGMTKNELVGQIQGTLAQQARQAQQAPQRSPQAGGIPQLPAGNMQRMAGGGIVSYAEGGPLKQDDVNAQLKKQIELALQLGESPEALAERLKDNPNALAILRSSVGDRAEERLLGMPTRDQARQADNARLERIRGNLSPSLGPINTEKLVADMGVTPLSEKPPKEEREGILSMLGEQFRNMPMSRQAAGAQQRIGEAYDESGLGAAFGQSVREIPGYLASIVEPITSGTPFKVGIGGVLQDKVLPQAKNTVEQLFSGRVSETPQAESQGVEQLQEIDLSAIPERKTIEQGIASVAPQATTRQKTPRELLMEELARQNDPDKIRRDELRQFLIGASRGSNLGSAMAGGSSALANARKNRDANRIANLEKLAKMDADEAAAKIERDNSKALQDIRTMQADTQRFSAIAAQYDTVKAQLETVLLQDDAYKDAVEELEDEKNAWFPNADDIAKAEAKVAQAMENAVNKVPSFRETKRMYEELLAKMSGGSTTSSDNVPTSGFTVRQKS